MKQIVLSADEKNYKEAQAFVRSLLLSLCLDGKALKQLELVVEELFVNISHYAYGKEGGSVRIFVEVDLTLRGVKIVFCDSGIPFNPLELNEPDVTLSADKRPVGGLGIFLAKKYMDKLEYKRSDGMNVLTVCKSFL